MIAAVPMIALNPAVKADPVCTTASCKARVQARVYAATHGGCYSRTCSLRVRAKYEGRMIRRLTPYHCATGRFAVPCYIIACESHGSWTAANPSGAVGPYQLLGWGAPWPADTRAKRLAHHRIAARLWDGGKGASNWACA
jgi:hypothetical protein